MRIDISRWRIAKPYAPKPNIRTFIADIDDNLSLLLTYPTTDHDAYKKCEVQLIRQEPLETIYATSFRLEPHASTRTAKEKAVRTITRRLENDIQEKIKAMKSIKTAFTEPDQLDQGAQGS